jgi:hypothetical protein
MAGNADLRRSFLRWAVLEHDFPFLHWDLLLERQSALAAMTWRLLRRPVCGEPIAAEALADHRVAYFDYEGPVSGGRGRVRRLYEGEWVECQNDQDRVREPVCEWSWSCSVVLRVEFRGGVGFERGELGVVPDGRLFWRFSEA